MTNQEIINALTLIKDSLETDTELDMNIVDLNSLWADDIGHAIKALEEQERYRWIPVEERLPEDRNEKLVYLTSGRISIAIYNDHILPHSGKCIGWGYDAKHPMDFELEGVIAWQPLPDPYKEGKWED